ncbi:hypothetical protein [Ideonella alba]|uniref:hypothetical protein n=1 Tax=Ideonella alba TaxID=2824118 RepID=UPI001FFD458D|nr:hypothetical protein [Ideonella alba]
MHPHHVTISGQAHVRAGEQLSTIDLGLRSWDEAVRLLLAAHLHATAEGQRMVETHLVRMAQIADLAQNAVALLDRLPDAAMAPLGKHWTQLRGALLQRALTLSGPASPTVSRPAPETQGEAQRPPLGLLAQRSGQDLPLEICYSAAGFYLGTYNDEGPYTRESQEYWPQREQAQRALDTGHWTQRSDH